MQDTPDSTEDDAAFIGTFDLAYLFLVYLIYVAAGLLVLVPTLAVLASIVMFVGIFMVWVKKRTRHPVLSTHYLWLRRTFWIGMGVYLTAITGLMLAIAAPAMDTTALMDGILDGTLATPEQMNDLLLAQQPVANLAAMAVLGGLFAIWWLWRCGHGLMRLWQQRPLRRPESWL